MLIPYLGIHPSDLVSVVEDLVSIQKVHVGEVLFEAVLYTQVPDGSKDLACVLDHDRDVDRIEIEHLVIANRVPTRTPHQVASIEVTTIPIQMDHRIVEVILGWRQVGLGYKKSDRLRLANTIFIRKLHHVNALTIDLMEDDSVSLMILDFAIRTYNVLGEVSAQHPLCHVVRWFQFS